MAHTAYVRLSTHTRYVCQIILSVACIFLRIQSFHNRAAYIVFRNVFKCIFWPRKKKEAKNRTITELLLVVNA